jgi:hypothetical protein
VLKNAWGRARQRRKVRILREAFSQSECGQVNGV